MAASTLGTPPTQGLMLHRELRLRNLEAFRVRRYSEAGSGICFLLIVDHGRPSTIDDFPYLKDVAEPEDFGRNFIQVIALHPGPLTVEEKDEIVGVTNGVVEGDGDCNYVVVFEPLPAEALHAINESRPRMLAEFERILAQHGVQADLSHIREEKWGRLSQD